MDTPSSFIPYEHPLVGVEEHFDLLPRFSYQLHLILQKICCEMYKTGGAMTVMAVEGWCCMV